MQLELDQRIAPGCNASEVLTTPRQMSDTPEFGQRTYYLILSISPKDIFINSPSHSLLPVVSGWSRCLWKMPRKAPSKIYPGFAAKLIEPGPALWVLLVLLRCSIMLGDVWLYPLLGSHSHIPILLYFLQKSGHIICICSCRRARVVSRGQRVINK